MEAYETLVTRVTPSILEEPAPDHEIERKIVAAALRAPDHKRLKPWRFISIRGDARAKLGEIFAAAYKNKAPNASPEVIARENKKPLRAPLILVVLAKIVEDANVPAIDQKFSAAAAAQNIILASEALGFGAVWKTGDAATDPLIREALGVKTNEEIVAYIYIGTVKARPNPPAPLEVSAFLTSWPA
ncbi:nitroreductase [Rhodomicrobium vannielii ATCC 17100]|uniref:Putative NAD(P)H nitroreductase n=1 Tax=Rhodomicrobium vannielii (strain ATCC 17100 / DSM 162 / LMG 4299 / NCIMB 10020 / ATH 3.1.1) TaxID=648757 RepID=E3I5M0_RHOVT|nr:nitroreductase [Rhodomicrobium vannielii]ADP72831.1 nitroreductase [Rhodomicrobium vannielii ATCC 17100]